MQIDVEVPAGTGSVLAQQTGGIGFLDRGNDGRAFVIELAANVDIGRMGTHGETGNQRTFDQLVRLMAHDLPVLTGTGLGFIGIDHEVMRTVADFLRHEGPLHTGRETRTTTTTQAGGLHLLDNGLATLGDDILGIVPVTALLGGFQISAKPAIDIGENTVFILQHGICRLLCRCQIFKGGRARCRHGAGTPLL